MQELLYVAAHLIASGRRLKLAFGYGCPIVSRLPPALRSTGDHLEVHRIRIPMATPPLHARRQHPIVSTTADTGQRAFSRQK